MVTINLKHDWPNYCGLTSELNGFPAMESLRLVLSFLNSAYACVDNLLALKKMSSIESVDKKKDKICKNLADTTETYDIWPDKVKHNISCHNYKPVVSHFCLDENYELENRLDKFLHIVNKDKYNKCHTLMFPENSKNCWSQKHLKCCSVVHPKIDFKRRFSQLRKTKSENRHDFNEDLTLRTTSFINQLRPSNVTDCKKKRLYLRNSVSESNIFIKRKAAGQNNMSNYTRSWIKIKDNKEEKSIYACSSKVLNLSRSSSCDSMQSEFRGRVNTSDHKHARIGHRISDDMINLYCERLQNARAQVEKIEGLLAMQFLTCEPDSVRNHISGKDHVFQVIFDCERMHYVLLEYVVHENCVRLYDSMLPSYWSTSTIKKLFCENVQCQIRCLFGHLFHASQIPVLVVCGLESQSDGWSCGFRVIFYLTLRVFNSKVENYNINIKNTAKFFNKIMDCPKPSLNQFKTAVLGEKRQTPREIQYIRVQINKSSMDIFL